MFCRPGTCNYGRNMDPGVDVVWRPMATIWRTIMSQVYGIGLPYRPLEATRSTPPTLETDKPTVGRKPPPPSFDQSTGKVSLRGEPRPSIFLCYVSEHPSGTVPEASPLASVSDLSLRGESTGTVSEHRSSSAIPTPSPAPSVDTSALPGKSQTPVKEPSSKPMERGCPQKDQGAPTTLPRGGRPDAA